MTETKMDTKFIIMTQEEAAFCQVCKEMGIEWKNAKGESIVEGIPISKWFLMHNITNDEEIRCINSDGEPIYYKRITLEMLNKIENGTWHNWTDIVNNYFISKSFLENYGQNFDWFDFTRRIITASIRKQQSMGDEFYDKWHSYINWKDIIIDLPHYYGPSRDIINKYKDLILHQYEMQIPDFVSKEDKEKYMKSYKEEDIDRY